MALGKRGQFVTFDLSMVTEVEDRLWVGQNLHIRKAWRTWDRTLRGPCRGLAEGELSREREGSWGKGVWQGWGEMLTKLMLGVGGSSATAHSAPSTQYGMPTASYLVVSFLRICPPTSPSLHFCVQASIRRVIFLLQLLAEDGLHTPVLVNLA